MALPEVNIINGTLVADPELRFIPSGKAVVNFRTASNSRRKNPDTQQWENGDSTFLTVNAWEGLAENIAETFKKGDKVNIKGRLKQREYEKDGQKRTVFEVEADEVSVPVSRFKDDGGAHQGNPQGNRAPANDPWNSAPPQGGFQGGADNPPF